MKGQWKLRYLAAAAALGCMFALGVPTAEGQTSTGTIRGFVKNAEGTPLVEAVVTATQPQTNVQRSAITTRTGFFNIAGLSPGEYVVTVQMISYAELERRVRVQIGQVLTLDLVPREQAIALGAIAVEAERATETRTPEIATNVTLEQIENVPINDRNFLTLALLVPGVSSFGGSVTSGGQSPNNMNVFLDGVSFKNDMLVGGVVGQDASQGNPFPQAAVQEFRVITQQYKAEYAKATSAVITATTKSGTNTWTGEAFLFGQNKDLVARDYFSRERCRDGDDATLCPDRPKRDKWQGGLSLGGPILRDKLFFFGTYEGHHQNRDYLVEMQNREALQALRPDIVQQLAQEEGTFNGPVRSNLYFGKLTYVPTVGSPHRFELSTSIRDEYDLRDFGGINTRGAATQFVNDVNTFAAKHQFASGAWLNELSASYQTYQWHPVPDAGLNAFDLVYRVNNQGVLNTGGRCCQQDWVQSRFSLRNDVTHSLAGWFGDHVFKFGANVDFANYDITQANFINPRFIFNSSNDYAFPIEAQAGFGTPGAVIDNTQFGLYLQDDWNVSERLALNLGVRWDYETNESNNEHVTPAETRTALETYRATLPCGEPSTDPHVLARQQLCNLENFMTDGSQRESFKGAFQPRFGFSYDLLGNQRTVLFGGFGVFYDRNRVGTFISEIQRARFQTYTYRFSADGTTPGTIAWQDSYFSREGLENILTSVPNPPAGELHLYANDLKPPRTNQFSAGVRQSLGAYQLSASYAGVRGHNYTVMIRANRRPDGSCCEPAPDNHWSNLFVARDEGRTWYDALLFKAERRYSEASRWGAQLAYTLASTEQNVNPHDRFSALNEFAPSTMVRYPSGTDERHHVTANMIVGLPYDFRVSGIVDLGSGTPFNPTLGFGPGTNPCDHGNADCLGGNDYPPGTTRNWFRPRKHDFIIPNAWTFRNVDLRVEKRLPTFRGQEVGLIAEVFNVFNYANFSGYNTNYGRYICPEAERLSATTCAVEPEIERNLVDGSPTLGTPTAVVTDLRNFGAPRRYQLGMRYKF